MVQILQKPLSWKEQFGAGIGQGLSQAIQSKLHQYNLKNSLIGIGVPQDQAGHLSQLPDNYLELVLKGIMDRGGFPQPQQDTAQSYGQQAQQQQPNLQQMLQTQQSDIQQMLQTANPQKLMQLLNEGTLGQGMGQQPAFGMEALRGLDNQNQMSERQATGMRNGLPVFGQEQQQYTPMNQPQKPQTVMDIFRQPTLKEQRSAAKTQQQFWMNRGQNLIEATDKRAEEARVGLNIVKQLRDLNSQVSSGVAGYYPLGKSDETQLFEDIASRLIPLAQASTNTKLQELTKRYPKITDSPKVRERKLLDLEAAFTEDLLRQNVLEQILQEQEGIPARLDQMLKLRYAQTLKGKKFPSTQSLQAMNLNPLDVSAQLQKPEAQQQRDVSQIGGLGLRDVEADIRELDSNRQPGEAGRIGAQLLGRGAEGFGKGVTGIAAAPFNIANLASGGRIPVPETVRKFEELPETIVRGFAGNIVQPKTETERRVGDFVSDVASFMSPGAVLGKTAQALNAVSKAPKWLNTASQILKVSPKAALAIAGTGNAAAWAAKKLGAGPKGEIAAKMGTMLAVPLIGTRLAGQLVNKLESQIGQAIQPNDVVKSPTLANSLGQLYNSLKRGIQTPAKEALLSEIESMPSTRFTVSKLWNLNKALQAAENNPEIATGVVEKLLPRVTKEVMQALQKVERPELAGMINDWQDLSAATQTTNRLADVFKKNFTYGTRNPALTALLFGLGVTRRGLIPYAGAALGAEEIARMIRMAYKSPAFRKYYGDLITAASLGETKSLNETARKLDKITDKEYQKAA